MAIGAYGLTQACLQIAYGSASDRFGRKYGTLVAWCITTIIAAYAAWKNH